MTSRCLYEVPVGRKQRVCITPRRHLQFFGSICGAGRAACPPRPLGCGSFACAFPHKDSDKVTKITSDPADLATMQIAGSKYGPRLFEAWDLSVEGRPLYGLVVEKLIPAGGHESEAAQRAESRNAGPINCLVSAGLALAPWQQTRAHVRQLAERCCTPAVYPGAKPEACKLLVSHVAEIREALARKGVDWLDIKAPNIGWSKRDQRWKALDLGFTGKKLAARVPVLQGGRRR